MLYRNETWTQRQVDKRHSGGLEVWDRMINISWQDRTKNDDILRRIKLKRKMLDAIANIKREE